MVPEYCKGFCSDMQITEVWETSNRSILSFGDFISSHDFIWPKHRRCLFRQFAFLLVVVIWESADVGCNVSSAYWTYLFIKMSLAQGTTVFPDLLQIRHLRQLAGPLIFLGECPWFFLISDGNSISHITSVSTETPSAW